MKRLTNLCLWCVCYHLNWDDEVRKTMDEQGPGESCSQGENIGKHEECHCYQAIERGEHVRQAI